jgi:hypothetical protein
VGAVSGDGLDFSELVAATEPDALEATLAAKLDELAQAGHEHGGDARASVRRATHDGHEIVVRTTYEITVDGEPFDVHMNVDNAGRVHYHGLPTRDFASVIDLVAKVIDAFPGEFTPADPHHPEGHSGGHEEHGGDGEQGGGHDHGGGQ